MSRADELHRLNIIAAIDANRTINIYQANGDPLLGVHVIELEERSGNVALSQDGATRRINLRDITGVEFEYLVREIDVIEPKILAGNVLQGHFHRVIGLKFFGKDPTRVHHLSFVSDTENKVDFVDIDSGEHSEKLSQVEEIHIR